MNISNLAIVKDLKKSLIASYDFSLTSLKPALDN